VSLTAGIEAPSDQAGPRAFSVTLRITNPTSRPIAILNPDMGVPSAEMGWTRSQDVYRTAMLISFGFLSLSVTSEAGRALRQEVIPTWATPVLRPPVKLAPGQSLELAIPLGAFFRLQPGKTYQVAVTYGDRSLQVSTQGSVSIPWSRPR
jgi:hypothetical protein